MFKRQAKRKVHRAPVSRFSLRRMFLERLEPRRLLAIDLDFDPLAGALTLTENGSAADDIAVTETTTNAPGDTVRIDLNGDNFDAGSTAAAAGLTYFDAGGAPTADPTTAVAAEIEVSAAISLDADTGADSDQLLLGPITQVLASVTIDGGAGTDQVELAGLTASGAVDVAADQIEVSGDVVSDDGQSYQGPVLLTADVMFRAMAGDIDFANFVDADDDASAGTADFGMQAIADAGGVTFAAEVGGGPGNQTGADADGLESLTVGPLATSTVVSRSMNFDTAPALPAGSSIAAVLAAVDSSGYKALLPGQVASPENFSNFSRGINSIHVDISRIANPAGISAADFELLVGTDDHLDGWQAAPAPAEIRVDLGRGDNGSDRVTINWPDNAIENQWLQVKVLATPDTGLTQADVHFWGNAVGDSGNNQAAAEHDLGDVIQVRRARGDLRFDYNRDGRVDAADADIARAQLRAGTPPLPMLDLSNMQSSGDTPTQVAPVVAAVSATTMPTMLGGDVTTAGDQNFNEPVILTADVTVTADNITFAQTVDGDGNGPWDLELDSNGSGATTLGGVVGGTQPLDNLTTNADGTTLVNGGAVTTAGDQSYGDAVTLGANTVMTGSAVSFVTVDGDNFDLTLDFSMLTVVDAAVLTNINDFAAGGGGTTRIDSNFQTTGTQTYHDSVTLAVDTTLTGTTITLNAGADATTAGMEALQIAGNLVIGNGAGDDLGASAALEFLTVSGTTTINSDRVASDTVTTAGLQTYTGAVTLAGTDTRLTSTGGGNITFHSTIDGTESLTVSSDGDVNFNGQIGTSTPIDSLAAQGFTAPSQGQTNVNTGVIIASGNTLTFNSPVVLMMNTALTDAGNITFNNTVDGGFTLTLNTPANTVFNAAVGGATPLLSLTTNAGGTTQINGGAVTTTAGQTYGDAVTLGAAATTITSNIGLIISFGSTVDGASNLSVNTGSVTRFVGAVGGGTPLTSVTTNAGGLTQINGGAVSSTGAQTYGDAVTLGAANTTLTSSGGGNITFDVTVNGASNLTANTNGTTTFTGAVGGGTPLTSLTTNADGTTQINGGAVTTTGFQSYGDAVTLGAAVTTLTSTGGGDIALGATVDGASDLIANTSGATIFSGIVGGATALTSIMTDAGGQTKLNVATAGTDVTTTGDQVYGDAVLLMEDSEVESTGGDITFDSFVDAADNAAGGTSDSGLRVVRLMGSSDSIFQATVGGDNQDDPPNAGFMDSDADGIEFLEVLTNAPAVGPFRLIDNITTSTFIDVEVVESAPAGPGDDLKLVSGITVTAGTDIDLKSGDNMTIDPGVTVTATAGTLSINIDFGDNDPSVGNALRLTGAAGTISGGTQTVIAGGGDNDVLDISLPRLVDGMTYTVDGGGQEATTRAVTSGGAVAPSSPFTFASVLTQSNSPQLVGDRLILTDRFDASDDTYDLTSTQFVDSGALTIDYANIEMVGVEASAGNDKMTVTLPDAAPALPPVVIFDGGGSAGEINNFVVIGSSQNDSATVGDLSAPANVPAASLGSDVARSQFEISDVQFIDMRGEAGNDTLVNNTAVPSQLGGGSGDDVLSGGSARDVLFGGGGVDALFGNDGNDFGFTDLAVDGSEVFADGDLFHGGAGIDQLVQTGALDLIISAEILCDGGGTKDVLTWLTGVTVTDCDLILAAARDFVNSLAIDC